MKYCDMCGLCEEECNCDKDMIKADAQFDTYKEEKGGSRIKWENK